MIYIIMFIIVITKLPQRRVHSMSLCTTHNRCVIWNNYSYILLLLYY